MCDNTVADEENNNTDLQLNKQNESDENKEENTTTGKNHIMMRIKKYSSGFSGDIAMEAVRRASKIIAEKERIQKVYSGVGLKNPKQASEQNDHLNYDTTVDVDDNTPSLNTTPSQKKL
ncbi:hypothetical protein YYE_03858 [Plasmodium vinckei vinckei]|uniref:Uncharacterized protein n=1 Tax=Plasmodium vinckei vinckei TaxID=54757 RepID=A0A081IC62_PLAVN|nr:hypothetical protein YYE_03858 [Plasmodium vinckei vinckei]